MTPPNWRQLTIQTPCDRLLGMGKAIKNLFVRFVETFSFPRDLFDVGAGERHYTPSYRDYVCSNEDAWREDWRRIGGDFQRAFARLSNEYASAEKESAQ